MAATGSTPISLYYTTTASTAPTAGNLVNGELAINITDGKLFYKDNAGVVQTLAQKGGVGVSSFNAGTTGLTPNTATTGAVTLAGTLAVANGGTGAATLTTNNVILGNGTSAVQVVAPGTTGNVLTSNGTTWVSQAAGGGGAAGSNTQVQYNNGGVLAGSSALTFNGTTLATTTLQSTNISDGTNSTSTTNCIKGSAKAWVNFTNSGSTTIVGSYNVSSVTYVSTGIYTVNLTNAMANSNYAIVTASGCSGGNGLYIVQNTDTRTTSAFGLVGRNGVSNAFSNTETAYAAIFS